MATQLPADEHVPLGASYGRGTAVGGASDVHLNADFDQASFPCWGESIWKTG